MTWGFSFVLACSPLWNDPIKQAAVPSFCSLQSGSPQNTFAAGVCVWVPL